MSLICTSTRPSPSQQPGLALPCAEHLGSVIPKRARALTVCSPALAGAALLKAERVYRDELTDHPLNGWSLLGLHNALSAQGKKHDEIDADFSTAWSAADVWINESWF